MKLRVLLILVVSSIAIAAIPVAFPQDTSKCTLCAPKIPLPLNFGHVAQDDARQTASQTVMHGPNIGIADFVSAPGFDLFNAFTQVFPDYKFACPVKAPLACFLEIVVDAQYGSLSPADGTNGIAAIILIDGGMPTVNPGNPIGITNLATSGFANKTGGTTYTVGPISPGKHVLQLGNYCIEAGCVAACDSQMIKIQLHKLVK